MNRDELIRVLRVDLILNDFSNITSEVSYEVRKEFFEGKNLRNTKGDNLFYYWGVRGIFQNLFTNEEAKNILNQYQDFASRSIIILNLSDEEKLKYMDEVIENDGYAYDENQKFSSLDFVFTIKNQEVLDQTILKLINIKTDLNRYDYSRILKSASSSLKKSIFDKMVELHSKGDENIISNFMIKNILNELPSEERKNAIFQILNLTDHDKKKDDGKRSGLITYSIDGLFETIPEQDQLEVLKEIKKYMEETGIEFSSKELLLNVSLENFKEASKMFINDNDTFDISFNIVNFAKKNSHLEQYIDIYLELQEETGKTLIDEASFASILRDFSEEIQEKLFIDYVFNKKVFDFESTIIHMNTKEKYKILDQAILTYLEQGYSVDEIQTFIDKHIINRNEHVSYPDGTNLYSNINGMYIQKYQLNPNNFNMFIERFGYCATKFLDNQNIIKALKMDEKDFLKYLEIFNENYTKLNNNDINTVCNALVQREFRLQQMDDYNIFSILESLLDSKETEYKRLFMQILDEVNQYVSISNYTSDTIEDFIIKLYSHNKETLHILHEITNHYIAQKRDIYSKKRLTNIHEELNLRKKISKQYYKKKYIEKFNYSYFRGDIEYRLHDVKLTDEQLSLLDNFNLLEKIFDFKKNPSEVNLGSDEKKYLKVFEGMLNLLYEQQIHSTQLESEDTIYEYEPFETKSESLLGIMSNIDPEVLKLNILSNNEIYQELLNIINKYHLLGWNNTFNPIFPLSDITFDEGTIAGMISYFNEISPKLDRTNTFLTKLIDYGNIYDATSQVYKFLLGKEDYFLIAANEGKNKASMPKYKRLEQVPELVKKMYERKYVTIPPMDKNIQLSNQKNLNVVIGNSTNMMNLTYGERTNACLRIGGAFDDLFRYCIENPNGFHIRFSDPKTNKFVSRVSGIRNGNTVFLNELRESEDEGYTNEDLIEAINIIASELIEKSKTSSMPIENVIITSDYALKEHEQEEQPLNIDDRKTALRNLHFNIKENSTGLVLKTSNPDNSLVPYRFTEDVPTYDVQREKIKLYTGEDADNKVIQMYMINELLGGKEIDEILTELSVHYQYCICSSDWFIAVDKDNQITKYIMPNTPNKEKAIEELQNSLQELETYKNTNDIENINNGGYKR